MQVPFPPHPHPFEHPGGRRVARVGEGRHPMFVARAEEIVEQARDRLGRMAVALILLRQGKADLGLARFRRRGVQAAVADHGAVCTQLQRKLKPGAGNVRVYRGLGRKKKASVFRREGGPALVAGDEGVGAITAEGTQVCFAESPQDQARRGEALEGMVGHVLLLWRVQRDSPRLARSLYPTGQSMPDDDHRAGSPRSLHRPWLAGYPRERTGAAQTAPTQTASTQAAGARRATYHAARRGFLLSALVQFTF